MLRSEYKSIRHDLSTDNPWKGLVPRVYAKFATVPCTDGNSYARVVIDGKFHKILLDG